MSLHIATDFAELTATVEARQRLDSQLTENEGVLKVSCLCRSREVLESLHLFALTEADKQEMNLLKPHNTVYKLVGPSLVPQDPVEAKVNVEKRLGFIKSEM